MISIDLEIEVSLVGDINIDNVEFSLFQIRDKILVMSLLIWILVWRKKIMEKTLQCNLFILKKRCKWTILCSNFQWWRRKWYKLFFAFWWNITSYIWWKILFFFWWFMSWHHFYIIHWGISLSFCWCLRDDTRMVTYKSDNDDSFHVIAHCQMK